MTDLLELICTDLRTDHIRSLNESAYSSGLRLDLDQLYAYNLAASDEALLVYLSALLLIKLDRVVPTGPRAIPMLYRACSAIAAYRPDLIPSMARYASSIVGNEMMKAENHDALDWAEASNFVLQYPGTSTTPRSATNIAFAKLFWHRANQMNNNPKREEVVETLDMLARARILGIELDIVSKIIAKAAIAGVLDRNDPRQNRFSTPVDTGMDGIIVQKVKELNLNYDLITKDIENLQVILGVPESSENAVEEWKFEYIINVSQGPEPPPGFLNEDVVYIDRSYIKITDNSIFARRTDWFQVAVHEAVWNQHPIAIKMYKRNSPAADFELVLKEIRCYQFLGRMSSDTNCFIRYYGTYVEGDSLNLVMDYYKEDLWSAINKKMTARTEFSLQTLTVMFKKLLISFAEMESLGIIHGDIKPQNILTDDYWNLKIIDFSVSVLKRSDLVSCTGLNIVQGTTEYMAPELLELVEKKQARGIFSPEKADVFSLGTVFLQLLTLRSLQEFNSRNKSQQMMAIVETVKYPWAKRLLRPMLNPNYQERPRFKDCLQFVDEVYLTLTRHQEMQNG